MNENVFQTILDKIIDYVPEGWNKIVFYSCYTNGSYSMKFYVKKSDNTYIDCFSIPGVSRGSLIKTFIDIDKIISSQRNDFEEDKRWTVLTMTVDNDGNMKTNYEYDDHSEDMIKYEEKWKNNNLI